MSAPQTVPAPTVLVVDDEPLVLRLMERALAAAGFQVEVAADGLNAVRVLTSLPQPPAVVVTDLRMDPVDGSDLAKIITNEWPSTRILFVSGWDPDHPVPDHPLLRKPFTPDVLVATVAKLLGQSPRTADRTA